MPNYIAAILPMIANCQHESKLVNAWYKGHWALWLLAPLSFLYGLISCFRRICLSTWWFKSQKFNIPVIVVGNISAGGTGKTPLTLAIVNT
jgi:tetraacyldisaccharide 4'-kinase